MTTRIQHIVVDDLDGTDQKVGTYRFAFDGVDYEIDLADHNFDKFAAVLRPYLAVARRLPKRTTSATGANRMRDPKASTIRRWWQDHQHTLDLPQFKTHGTIPHQVRAAFQTAAPADRKPPRSTGIDTNPT